jgi:AcrR family transcriptional regulator
VIAEPAVRLDRRHRRRQETVELVLEVAVAVMAEQGAAGLSLGEVARRMGIRPPSLYVYFDSKNALYDAIFARGSRELIAVMEPVHAQAREVADLRAYFAEQARTFIRWTVEHPAYSELMFWRPVPNYEPSAGAYAPAQDLLGRARAMFVTLRERGLFAADTDVDDALRTWTILSAGVMSQQLSNAPQESFDEGRFTTQLPELVAMFLAHYSSPTRRQRHADKG